MVMLSLVWVLWPVYQRRFNITGPGDCFLLAVGVIGAFVLFALFMSFNDRGSSGPFQR